MVVGSETVRSCKDGWFVGTRDVAREFWFRVEDGRVLDTRCG